MADAKCASAAVVNTEKAGGKVGSVRKHKERRRLTGLTWLISLLRFLTQTDLIKVAFTETSAFLTLLITLVYNFFPCSGH